MTTAKALLKEWRAYFDPEVGRALEALEPPPALTDLPVGKKARSAELAKRALESTDENRAAVLREFENFAREAPGALVWPSVEAWVEVERDPRVARMALRVLSNDEQSLTGKLWRRLVDCIEHHGDAGVADDARAYERALTKQGPGWGASPPRFSNVLKRLVKDRQCTRPAPAALLAGVKRQAPVARRAAPRDDGAFLDAIVRAPDDDAPRLVYADWLTEQERVEGEFITLQIQRARAKKATAAAKKREAELLSTERTRLLGPFRDVMAKSGLRFHRGFLVAGRALAKVPAHPLTQLFERLEFAGGFAKGARFDRLREAVGPAVPDRDRLPALAPQLRSWSVDTDEWDALVRTLGQTKLEHLRVRLFVDRGAALARLLPLPALAGLQSLELQCGRGNAGQLRLKAAQPALKTIRIETPFVEVLVEREGKAWAARVTVRWASRPEEVRTDVLGLVVASKDEISRVTLVTLERDRERTVELTSLLETFFPKVTWEAR